MFIRSFMRCMQAAYHSLRSMAVGRYAVVIILAGSLMQPVTAEDEDDSLRRFPLSIEFEVTTKGDGTRERHVRVALYKIISDNILDPYRIISNIIKVSDRYDPVQSTLRMRKDLEAGRYLLIAERRQAPAFYVQKVVEITEKQAQVGLTVDDMFRMTVHEEPLRRVHVTLSDEWADYQPRSGHTLFFSRNERFVVRDRSQNEPPHPLWRHFVPVFRGGATHTHELLNRPELEYIPLLVPVGQTLLMGETFERPFLHYQEIDLGIIPESGEDDEPYVVKAAPRFPPHVEVRFFENDNELLIEEGTNIQFVVRGRGPLQTMGGGSAALQDVGPDQKVYLAESLVRCYRRNSGFRIESDDDWGLVGIQTHYPFNWQREYVFVDGMLSVQDIKNAERSGEPLRIHMRMVSHTPYVPPRFIIREVPWQSSPEDGR